MSSNVVFDNRVIGSKFETILLTLLNASNYMTIDSSLTQSAGMYKTINTYTNTAGNVEQLAEGVGNSTTGVVSVVSKDYRVLTEQYRWMYSDEDVMKDPTIVDAHVKYAAEKIANKLTSNFYSALDTQVGGEGADADDYLVHTEMMASGKHLSYDFVVDCLDYLNFEKEDELFLLIPNKWKKYIRKDEDFRSAKLGEILFTGMIGTICGIPVVATKALTDEGFIMTKEAVTMFIKKNTEVESKRDPDKRENWFWNRAVYVCALTDASKAVRLVEYSA